MGTAGVDKSAAIAYTFCETAKVDDVDPQAWLIWVLGQIADHKIKRLDELTLWWCAARAAKLIMFIVNRWGSPGILSS